MLYLNNDTAAQTLRIPRGRSLVSAAGTLTLEVRNTVDLTEAEIPVTTGEITPRYITLSAKLPKGLADGSFAYRLLNAAGQVVSSGLLTVGDYITGEAVFEKEISYEQFAI